MPSGRTPPRIVSRATGLNARLTRLVREHPSAVLLLLPVYVVLTAAIAVASLFVVLLLVRVLGVDDSRAEPWFMACFGISSVLVWGHFIWLNLAAFASSLFIEGDIPRIRRVAEMLVTTIFVYAVIYYYLQLFSNNQAIAGMTPIDLEALKGWTQADERLPARMAIVPTLEVAVDCIYFSMVTVATVGYGDIHPVSPWAKLVVCSEVAAGFILIAIGLGSVIGATRRPPTG